ncbi:MAG TPA: SEC-C metal-binding domain-containing protein, partial [Haliangium sp.]|nr:SEC-C metal-binding domain-containing protein [Haliangium sp.]
DRLQAFRAGYTRGRFRRKNAVALERLTAYWESCWALGHLVALFGTVMREMLDTHSATMTEEMLKGFDMSWMTMRTLSTPMAVRGAWAVSRAGHHLLPIYKDQFEQEGTFQIFLNSVTALTAIGLRHRKLRAEVRKTLARRRGPLFAPDTIDPHGALVHALLPAFEIALDNEEEARNAHRQAGVSYVTGGSERLPPEHPLHGIQAEDVPDEVAFVLPLLRDTRLYGDPTAQLFMPFTLPWVVSVDIEELYLPAEALDGLQWPFQPDVILDQLDDYARASFRPGTLRREAAPGRNEPCSCGSGKKYKRCCGADA